MAAVAAFRVIAAAVRAFMTCIADSTACPGACYGHPALCCAILRRSHLRSCLEEGASSSPVTAII